jgi:SAM-dependent methyltransferase/rubredoxin
MMHERGLSEDRACPVCGATTHVSFADEHIDPERINDFTYASRKQPEFMCLRLVQCTSCNLVYAPTPPSRAFLSTAYADAAYDSGQEAQCAAQSYAHALAPYLAHLRSRNAAVDVGAGSGPLLPWLIDFGFQTVIGVEPSRAAINAAPTSVRPMLREGMFGPELLDGIKPSLICSFMTLEHMDDPATFVKTAYSLLEPGGMIALVVHNWQGLLNRTLGLRSPIIDVEHLQLFNPSSVNTLLQKVGFENINVKPICNRYPLKYWLRLTPLPRNVKGAIDNVLKMISLSDIPLAMRVGNIMAIGVKPKQEYI